MRHGLSELDLGIAGAGTVCLLGGTNVRGGDERRSSSAGGGAELAPCWTFCHCCFLPGCGAFCGHSCASGNSEQPHRPRPLFPRDGNHGLAATTTRPGTGTLSSVRGE